MSFNLITSEQLILTTFYLIPGEQL